MLRLPHPELVGLLDNVKRSVVEARRAAVAGADIPYWVFRPDPETAVLGGCYDEGGTIYVAESHAGADGRYADLTAYHEHVEIRHKLAGRSHAYAHRRAYVEELLAAKGIFEEPGELLGYLRRRLKGYPEWKVSDPEAVAARLAQILADDRPRKGELLRAITEHRL